MKVIKKTPIQKKNVSVKEDMVAAPSVGGSTGGGEIAAPTAIGGTDSDVVSADKGGMTTDILGKDCDHHKHGYLGPGCFHVPSRLRKEIYTGKKKKKNPYSNGMTVITDAENLKSIQKTLQTFDNEHIKKYILDNYNSKELKLKKFVVNSIAYHPASKLLFIKIYNFETNKMLFCITAYDRKTKNFVMSSIDEYKLPNTLLTSTEIITEFKKICDKFGNKSQSSRLKIVWK